LGHAFCDGLEAPDAIRRAGFHVRETKPWRVLDLSALPPTSQKRKIPWRENRLAVLLLRASGPAEQGYVISEKLRLVEACGPDDRLLAVWMHLRHPIVLWVDDLEAPRAALAG
jgi:hypothetical protein